MAQSFRCAHVLSVRSVLSPLRNRYHNFEHLCLCIVVNAPPRHPGARPSKSRKRLNAYQVCLSVSQAYIHEHVPNICLCGKWPPVILQEGVTARLRHRLRCVRRPEYCPGVRIILGRVRCIVNQPRCPCGELERWDSACGLALGRSTLESFAAGSQLAGETAA